MAKVSDNLGIANPRRWLTAATLSVLSAAGPSCGGKALLGGADDTAGVTGGVPSSGSGGASSASGGKTSNTKPPFPGTGGMTATTEPAMMPSVGPTVAPPPVMPSCPTSPKELAYFLSASIWGNVAYASELAPMLDVQPTADVIKFMQTEPRSHAGLEKFALDWFGLPSVSIAFTGAGGSAGAANSPQYTPEQLMAEEGRLFVGVILQDNQGTLERIFTSTQSVLNQQLAAYYAVPSPASPPGSDLWNTVDLGNQERFGIFTRGFWLARNVNSARRGKALLQDALCSQVPPPPPGAPPHGMVPPPQLSGAEIQEQLNNPACQACHSLIEPPGRGFEHFNGIGQYRTVLAGQPIDSSGYVMAKSAFKFENVRALMSQLSSSSVSDSRSRVAS